MRILLAHDLSPDSDRAAALIGGVSWPGATVVRVVSSPMGAGPLLSSFAGLREARTHAREARHAIALAHGRVAADLRDAGVLVEAATVAGKPARAIVTDANRFGADLIVVGARDQGPIAAMLLGSVSRAIVEDAPCSVLVSRGSAVSRVMLATDGSPPARVATSIVATWPLFADARIRVVGVGEAPPRYPRTVLSDDERLGAFDGAIAMSTSQATDVVEEAVEELAARGRQAEAEIRLGEAGQEVVAAAQHWPADLVVVGSRGQSLLRRLLLGSVARTVLDGVGSSVLVARPRAA